MSKVLFIGDPHLQINRFDLALQFLKWVNQVVFELRPDLVVNLGDTFHNHAVLRSEIMTEFINHVEYVYAEGIPYVYLLGNHDMYKPKSAKYHALKHFRGKMRRVYIIDETEDRFGMTFVPYQADPSKFPKKSLPICVAHQTFIGADYGSITTKQGVDPADVEGAEIIISGHIHTRHTIPAIRRGDKPGVPVSYPGTPFPQSSDDVNQIKGLTLFDTETFAETLIECPLPKWRGLRYELTQVFTTNDLQDDLQLQINDKDHWTVEITGTRTEITNVLNSKRHIDLVNGKDVRIKPVYTDKEKRKLRIEARSMDQIVSDYVAKVYTGSLDKSLVLSSALALVKQANQEQ